LGAGVVRTGGVVTAAVVAVVVAAAVVMFVDCANTAEQLTSAMVTMTNNVVTDMVFFFFFSMVRACGVLFVIVCGLLRGVSTALRGNEKKEFVAEAKRVQSSF
jgi:hypothetical protein